MNINIDQARAERCRRSLFHFVQEFWSEVSPEEPVWNWHIEYLCDEFQKDLLRLCRIVKKVGGKETIIKEREEKLHDGITNVPPGSSKSTIYTIMAPAWLWTIDPTIKILTASYSADLAIDHAVKSRDVIQSDRYRKYFPEVEIRSDHNNKANYKNTKLGERYATSVGGSVTGFHAHLLLCDDPLNTKQSASEGELESASSFMDSTIPTRKVDKKISYTHIVMQRLNEMDPTGNWLRKKGKRIKHICLPALLQDNVSPPELKEKYKDNLLDPKRMPLETLDEMKLEMGSYNFAGQMQQSPAPEGGGVWQKWIIAVPDREMPQPHEMNGYGTDWDTAYTDKKTNASSAYINSGRIGKKMYIDGLGFFNKEFPDLINAMRLQPAPHYIEAKACFSAGTKVRTTQGLKYIYEIKAGDQVYTVNVTTGKTEIKTVFELLQFRGFQFMVQFTFHSGETMLCTTNHELHYKGAWHSAGSIAEDIRQRLGAISKVPLKSKETYADYDPGKELTGIPFDPQNSDFAHPREFDTDHSVVKVRYTHGERIVFDLRVEDNHNYLVTAYDYLAHNSGKSAKQTLTTAGIPAIEVQVNNDKLARAKDATPKAEAGMVYCRASILDKLYNDDQQGILKFPNGPKADVADTLSQAIQRHFGREIRIAEFGWGKEHDFMPRRILPPEPNLSFIMEPKNDEQLLAELEKLDKPEPVFEHIYDDGADLI